MGFGNSIVFDDSRERFLRGIVTPIDWDRSGLVTRIALVGKDGKRYKLSKHGNGPQLFDHMGQHVEVRGIATEDSEGDWVFVVYEFQID